MSEAKIDYGIHCNKCEYEGYPHTNSSTIFIIFFLLLCTSVLFLPLIIVALIYMAIAIAKPATKSCPKCKSTDIIDLEAESAKPAAITEENIAKTSENHSH